MPFKEKKGRWILVLNQMLNIFYFTHLHTKMNPFLHKNSPQCHYFYWRLQTIYCAVIKHGLFLRYCKFEYNLPIHCFFYNTPWETTRKEKRSVANQKTGYDIVQWWRCNRSQTLIKGHNEQVPEGNHIQASFLQLRGPLISIKIKFLFTVHLLEPSLPLLEIHDGSSSGWIILQNQYLAYWLISSSAISFIGSGTIHHILLGYWATRANHFLLLFFFFF